MPTLTFQQGTNGYSGTVDTFIKESNPTKSYVTSTPLYVDGTVGANHEALLTFNGLFGTGAGQIPLGATITSATLTLETTNSTSGSVSFHRMLIDWATQTSVTWSSLGAGIQFDGTEAASAADLTASKIALGTGSFDVTSSLQAWSAGAQNYGWAIRTSSTDGWQFSSSEAAVKPTLTVSYSSTGPDPGFTISQATGAVTEGGATDSFTMALTAAPTSNVVVTILDTSDVSAGPHSLTFTPTNWSAPQTIKLTAVDDTLIEGTETSNIGFSVSSSDLRYDGFNVAPVSVTVYDNDSAAPSPPPTISAHVVQVIDTTKYKTGDPSGYGIGDPSGIAYVPGMNALFIVDSEHDESPYRSSTNMWAISPNGTSLGAYSLTSFTKEPTGIGYNPTNGYLYITDDDHEKVFWVDPAKPSVKLGEFSVAGYGIMDAEDPKIDPVTGHIYMLNGDSRTLFELSSTGSLIRSVPLPSAMLNAEGLAYSSKHDVFFVSSGSDRGTIFEIDGSGHLLNTINLLNSSTYYNPAYGSRPYLKGLELAPSSNPNDGDRLSLYAIDYGKDQKNDGRLFEIDLGPGWTSGTNGNALVASTSTSETKLGAGVFEANPTQDGASHAHSAPQATSTPTPALEALSWLHDAAGQPLPTNHIV